MLELTADRLVLVETAARPEFAGSLDDYIDLVLGRNQAGRRGRSRSSRRQDRKAAAKAREDARALKKAADRGRGGQARG